jgi:serine/threonine protein kinase
MSCLQFNVLIDGTRNAVLCDFGIARIKDDVLSTSLNSREISITGTPSFMAPERLKGGPLRRPCDVYAFGMLIYEVFISRCVLFLYKPTLQVHANANPLSLHIGYSEFVKFVAIDGHRPERPDGDEVPQLTDDIWRVAERCWEGKPASRPSIDNVCDMIAPSVKLYDNHPVNTVPRPERPHRDEALQLTDDIGDLAERTATARPSMDDVYDNIAPSVKLSADTIPRSGGPSNHVPSPSSSAYDRIRAGATFRESFVIRTPCKQLYAVTMTHDDKIIASSGGPNDEGIIHTWNSTSGARIRSLQGHTGGVWFHAFFNNGSLVSGSRDTTIRVWDLASSTVVIMKHYSPIECLSLSTDNKTIVTGFSGYLSLWDANTGHNTHNLVNAQFSDILSISISSNPSILMAFGFSMGSMYCATSLWQQQPDGEWVIDDFHNFFRDRFTPTASSCSSSSLRFALSSDHHLAIYDLRDKKAYVNEGCGEVIFSSDGEWLVGIKKYESGERALKIWDAASGKMLSESQVLTGRGDAEMNAVFISHDGSTILTGDDGFVRVFALTESILDIM